MIYERTFLRGIFSEESDPTNPPIYAYSIDFLS
jgi:hypothetical protein